MPSGAEDPSQFLRGVLPSVSWADGSRLPATATSKLTIDTVRAARVPAGIHLAFSGTARAVEVVAEAGDRTSAPAPTVPEAFVARVPGQPAVVVPLSAVRQPARILLPERDPGTVVRLYLPEAVELRVSALSPVDGEIMPAARGPLWVVYGDSISQGWSVTEPGLAWPSLVADELGFDLVNLGFAGSARGELPTADAVGASGADAVAVAWGTNAWSSLPTDATGIAGTMRLFLTALRQGLPDAPVVVVSPIVRPAAEDTRNRFGATLHDLRAALEDAVLRFAADTDDHRLTLVPGSDLLRDGQLVDGIHPGDDGHRTLAASLAPHVAAGLRLAATGSSHLR
jgi:lysophospholipase L1-like esterase